MPASSAAETMLRAAGRSVRTPKLLQPSPSADTRTSVVPSGRSSMRVPRRLAKHAFRIPAEDQVTRGGIDRCRAYASDAIQVSHVERIVAAQQHTIGTGFADKELKRRFRMQDRV